MNFVRRHERKLIVVWLAVTAAILGFVGLDVLKLGLAERWVHHYTGRWTRRVDHGEELLTAGRPERAAQFLSRLETEFPARHPKHALDRDRERLLLNLGRAYEATGKSRRARETYARLAAFDPRNFVNHFEQGFHLVEQGRGEEARAPLERAFAIHPSYFPTARALVGVHFDEARWRDVVDVWERYLDSVVLAEVTVFIEGRAETARVLVDGRERIARFPLALPPGPRTLRLRTEGYAARIGDVLAAPQPRVGLPTASPRSLHARLGGRATSTPPRMFLPKSRTAEVELTIDGGEGSPSFGVVLNLYKPANAQIWRMVEKSYGNLLEREARDAAALRSHPPAGDGR